MLPDDVARCHGLRDAYTDTVRPLPMCQGCARWQEAGALGPRTPTTTPNVVILSSGWRIACERRIAGEPVEG